MNIRLLLYIPFILEELYHYYRYEFWDDLTKIGGDKVNGNN